MRVIPDPALAAEVKRIRLAKGWTHRELAWRAGVSNATVSMIETGKISPRHVTVNKILRACGYELRVVSR